MSYMWQTIYWRQQVLIAYCYEANIVLANKLIVNYLTNGFSIIVLFQNK